MFSSAMPIDQVQQRKKVNPHDVYKVPIEAGIFDRRVVLLGVMAFPGKNGKHAEKAHAHDHVDGVHTGHDEVKREEHLRIALVYRGSVGFGLFGNEMEGGAGDMIFLKL